MRIRLQNKRLEKGHTQRQMAKLLNISLSAYQRIESEESGWGEEQIIAAATVLKCGPEEIMQECYPRILEPDTVFMAALRQVSPTAGYMALFTQAMQTMQQQFELNSHFMTQELPEMIKRILEENG